MNLKNVVINVQPSTALYREEIEALLEVLDKVFYRIGTPKHGTFLLWGVADGSYDVHKFISFDFEKGHKKHFLGQDEDSRTMAEWILSQDAMREEVGYSAVTNMYNSPYYLSINSTFGRFTCAFFEDNGSFAEQLLVYTAVAKALAIMGGSEDHTLQEGFEKILMDEWEDNRGIITVSDYVEELLDESSSEKLALWKDRFGEDGEDRCLFFEDFYQEPEEPGFDGYIYEDEEGPGGDPDYDFEEDDRI